MSVSEAQKRATAAYEKKNYDKILVRFAKGTKERIANQSKSVNAYIIRAVIEKLERDEHKETQITDQAVQEPQISPELATDDNSCIEQETSENEADTEPEKAKSEAERLAGIQALLDAKRAEEKARAEKIQKAREERKEQQAEEFREMMRRRRAGEISEEDQEKERIRQETIARSMCDL